ncbi:hypothetical protein N7471_013512 [Penicillium samsonianum]|uniref:uncharacterized protein n=1 Tax=Penicillium samsonianum TaxID=1882272 RepID=UPI0025483B33|nr:uncharacterized protein N7471_013512 [Penicillium samsonianum]KAJ6118892.1 hypothetical protein N7471_013512 [Penicillium samsonianum]
MSEVIYIPWSSAEEVNLLGWLSQHQHLSWDDKSNEYSDTFGHYRSPESLRGKQNQLMKGIRRQRLVSKRTLSELRHVAVRRTRRRRRRKFSDNLDSPPTSLGAPDPRERLQQQQDGSHGSSRSEFPQLNPTEGTNLPQSPDGTRSVSRRLWNIFVRVKKSMVTLGIEDIKRNQY